MGPPCLLTMPATLLRAVRVDGRPRFGRRYWPNGPVRHVQMPAYRPKRPSLHVQAYRLVDLRLSQLTSGLGRPCHVRRDRVR